MPMDIDASSSAREGGDEDSDGRRGPRRTVRGPATDPRFDVPVRGVDVGPETRCAHYHGPRDVIAIRFACCDVFYPCHRCHEETATHPPERWPRDQFDASAVLCGRCRTVLTIEQYLDADHTCPACGAAFNPNCARHHDRYFCVG
ncbi:putative CHY-type Zn-finger protein [Salinibacter ruber]|uniref:CHY-type Zn-finger protein n=2 Tax=Salinibacter ruber TaxID=146919 RepID=A0A9X2R1F1_9BACT|nr:CHY zinc finger protein [Salinibacter ruber]MCS3662773.1 putative CHY-type Zn-finger protein [Salinibacter ruber]MCS3830188.1 putative CHY-type Zn-finger protein [Salinibacter ruber]MCS4060522.1 putative CHY-type Zn-finger protein [Salinibacter ruber]MCS4120187.1 putative CHY-type Zn-finger protein [Salinibacter ruber]MCS4135602.1 putative CHY-type Zn-finger protein [Salinibacter ruber]